MKINKRQVPQISVEHSVTIIGVFRVNFNAISKHVQFDVAYANNLTARTFFWPGVVGGEILYWPNKTSKVKVSTLLIELHSRHVLCLLEGKPTSSMYSHCHTQSLWKVGVPSCNKDSPEDKLPDPRGYQ